MFRSAFAPTILELHLRFWDTDIFEGRFRIRGDYFEYRGERRSWTLGSRSES